MRFVQTCESRLLFTSIALSGSGVLTVDGSAGPPLNVEVAPKGTSYSMKIGGKVVRTFSKPAVKALAIYGSKDGFNRLTVSKGVDVPTTLRGGQGTDDIIAPYRRAYIESDFIDNISTADGSVIQYVWQGPGPRPKGLEFGISEGEDEPGFFVTGIGVGVPGDGTIGGEGNMTSRTGAASPKSHLPLHRCERQHSVCGALRSTCDI